MWNYLRFGMMGFKYTLFGGITEPDNAANSFLYNEEVMSSKGLIVLPNKFGKPGFICKNLYKFKSKNMEVLLRLNFL